jgi:predicted hydrocarbon binding protein
VLELQQEAQSIPPEQRLPWAVAEAAKHFSNVWATVTMRETPKAFYFDVEQCPICSRIERAGSPICASSEVIYTSLVRALSDLRMRFVEVQCRATGGARCSYELRR